MIYRRDEIAQDFKRHVQMQFAERPLITDPNDPDALIPDPKWIVIPRDHLWSARTDPTLAEDDELPTMFFGSAGSNPNDAFGSTSELGETMRIALHIVVNTVRPSPMAAPVEDGDLLTRSMRIKDQVQRIVRNMQCPDELDSAVEFRYGPVDTITQGLGDREMLRFIIEVDFAYEF